jgi:hypothetical protein
MTVQVPSNEKTGAAVIAAEIVVLSSRTDTYSVQKLGQRQVDLVSSLLGGQRLSAASILSTIPYNASKLPATIAAQIANLTVAANGTPAAQGAASQLVAVQNQAILELMSNGAIPAASILSTMTYLGGG